MSRRITKKDWNRVLSIMQQYNRKEGYVVDIDNTLYFFDSEPSMPACHVTIEQVKEYVEL